MKHLKDYKLFLESSKEAEDLTNYILDKISEQGIESLTKSEKDFLDSSNKGDIEKGLEDFNIENGIGDDVNEPTVYNKEIGLDSEVFSFYLNNVTAEDSNSDDGIITSYHGTMRVRYDYIDLDFDGIFQINALGIFMSDFYKEEGNIILADFIEDNNLVDDYDIALYSLSLEIQNLKND